MACRGARVVHAGGDARVRRGAHARAAVPVPDAVPDPGTDLAALNGHAHAAAGLFAADIEAGRIPGIRAIRSGLHVGQDKASQVQAYLRSLTRTQ
jgi:hypothetical protein